MVIKVKLAEDGKIIPLEQIDLEPGSIFEIEIKRKLKPDEGEDVLSELRGGLEVDAKIIDMIEEKEEELLLENE